MRKRRKKQDDRYLKTLSQYARKKQASLRRLRKEDIEVKKS